METSVALKNKLTQRNKLSRSTAIGLFIGFQEHNDGNKNLKNYYSNYT